MRGSSPLGRGPRPPCTSRFRSTCRARSIRMVPSISAARARKAPQGRARSVADRLDDPCGYRLGARSFSMMWTQSATHSLQMQTPGPAINLSTSSSASRRTRTGSTHPPTSEFDGGACACPEPRPRLYTSRPPADHGGWVTRHERTVRGQNRTMNRWSPGIRQQQIQQRLGRNQRRLSACSRGVPERAPTER
jgi:hypothetical protein